MVTIPRNIIFKPTKIENYQSSNGRCRQSQDYIKFDGDFNGTRRVVSSITISSQELSAYLNTDSNPSTPYVPLYPGSPTTKQYVDQHDTIVSATAPSNPTEGMVWYDTTNDSLKAYNGTSWETEGTKMVVLEYGVSTWQDFLDAYNKNAIVYCKVSSGSSGYRMAFMAYTAGQGTPTEVEFQYYRSRSSHSQDSTQLDEVYVYKLTNAGVWSTATRDTGARITNGTGISISSATSSGITTRTISADTSVLATKTYVDEHDTVVSSTAPSSPTEGMVWYDTTNDVLKVYNGTTWNTIATGGSISDTAYGSGWDGQTTIAPSQNAVYDKISTMDTAISSNTTNINTINNKIPSEASSSNQLADKAYVGDSINSVTAYYITKSANGDQFATYAELASATTFYSGGVVRTPTKNDYTIVLDDENHDHATTRYIYNNGWEYQYTVNETPLTQAQLNALNSGITAAKVAKYDTLNTREFTLSGVGSSATVLAEAQEVFDWINAGNFAILKIATDSGQPTYLYKSRTVDDLRFLSSDMVDGGYSDNFTTAMQKGVEIQYSGTTVTGVSYINNLTWQFLAINGQYQSAFMPTQDAHPATKKYVDSKSTVVSATAPSSPTEGMVWYDTTNDQLKVYDGTNWNVTGKEYNAGPGIGIGTVHSDMQGPASNGFHVPTYNEWASLCGILTTTFSLASTDATMKAYLKMPCAGWRGFSSSNVGSQGSDGWYWSSTGINSNFARSLIFGSNHIMAGNSSYYAYGIPIRCFKDSPVIPDSSWTTLYDGSSVATNAGIFYNSTLGLISVSGDGTTWYTIQDKNLGATTVYNNGDTLSEANCGKYYQRGNNYGFPFNGSITTSSTKVDASNYGPGNYYSSSTFITTSSPSGNWSSVQNDNLWGGVTQGVWVSGDGNTIANTGVLSVNGQTGAVTINEGDVKVFDFPAVNDDITDLITWLSSGGDAILKESNSYCRVTSYDGVNREIHALQESTNARDDWAILYNSSNIVTSVSSVENKYFNPGGTATTGYVVTKTASGYEWQSPSGGDVMVSSQPNNILTSGMKIWAGTEGDYANLSSYDNNTVYLTVEGGATQSSDQGQGNDSGGNR